MYDLTLLLVAILALVGAEPNYKPATVPAVRTRQFGPFTVVDQSECQWACDAARGESTSCGYLSPTIPRSICQAYFYQDGKCVLLGENVPKTCSNQVTEYVFVADPCIGAECPKADQLWNLVFYYNVFSVLHAFCSEPTCVEKIMNNGVGYDRVNNQGVVGRAIKESEIDNVRRICPTGSEYLANLGFTQVGRHYEHNLKGEGLKQGWVSTVYGACGMTKPIRRWKNTWVATEPQYEQVSAPATRTRLKGPFTVADNSECQVTCDAARGESCSYLSPDIPTLDCQAYFYQEGKCVLLGERVFGKSCSNKVTEHVLVRDGPTNIPIEKIATDSQMWNLVSYRNYARILHAFCSEPVCVKNIMENGIGYDSVNYQGVVGRAIKESEIDNVRITCPSESKNLANLGFTRVGNHYEHNLNGEGLKQGWVSTVYVACGMTKPIKRWKCLYSEDIMYDDDLEYNTYYTGQVMDGGKVHFWMYWEL